MNWQSPVTSRWFRVLLSAVIIGCVSLICYGVFGVNATTAGFAYLLCVLGIAANWGRLEALIASAVAAGCFNFFFLPPIGRLMIADPENWLALLTFVITALVASHLSDRAKREARDARNRERESSLLYKLSQSILLRNTHGSVGAETAHHLADIFGLPAVLLCNAETGETFHAGPEDLSEIEQPLIDAARNGATLQTVAQGVTLASVMTGDRCIGSIAMKGFSLSPGALQALLNLVAVAFERVQTQATVSRAEAARQSEEFKSTLLDAMAHEFKTPLTSIKVASTSILTDTPEASAHVRELAAIINAGADRLNLIVTDGVRMARMEASQLQLERKPIPADEFVRRVLTFFQGRWEERDLQILIPAQLPLLSADPDMASMALRQVIDNALKYSPPGTPLCISAEANGSGIKIRVRDYGPGIAENERKLIFERFYRQPGMKEHVPGSGLGLYVAREIVRAHGGDLWAEGASGPGAQFCLALPQASDDFTS